MLLLSVMTYAKNGLSDLLAFLILHGLLLGDDRAQFSEPTPRHFAAQLREFLFGDWARLPTYPVDKLLQADHRPAAPGKLYRINHETVINGWSEQIVEQRLDPFHAAVEQNVREVRQACAQGLAKIVIDHINKRPDAFAHGYELGIADIDRGADPDQFIDCCFLRSVTSLRRREVV
jgi:hypothetical protein